MKSKLLPSLLAGIFCLGLTGCETTDQGIPATQLKANLAQIKLGMTEDQVQTLIGKPAHSTSTISPAGAMDIWVYNSSQFFGGRQSFAEGMAEGMGRTFNHPIVYSFTNGKLTLITSSH